MDKDCILLIIALAIFCTVGWYVYKAGRYDRMSDEDKAAELKKGFRPKQVSLSNLKIMQQRIDSLQLRIIDIRGLPDGDKATKEKIANRLKILLDKAIDDYDKYVNS
jgi:Tfp pilus assembly protein PilO